MNKLIYFIILNILLIGSVYAEKNKFLNMAQSKVKQEMKDPDSTKFQNLREINNSVGESVVCGEVNAKNSYGGYVGYHLFSYSPDGVVILNSPKDSDYYRNKFIYDKSGCAGEKEEFLARNKDMFKNYCLVAYDLSTDVIVNNKTNLDAITYAMSNYQKYNLSVFNNDLDKAKTDLLANLEQVLQSKETVKKIKKDKNGMFKAQYMFICPISMEKKYIFEK